MSKKSSNQPADFKTMFREAEVVVPQQAVGPINAQQETKSSQTVIFPELEESALNAKKQRTKVDEVQLNVHIGVDLLKRLKLKGINERKNIKQMIAEAITLYTKS